jgi:hypothetical protein
VKPEQNGLSRHVVLKPQRQISWLQALFFRKSITTSPSPSPPKRTGERERKSSPERDVQMLRDRNKHKI